MKQVLVNTDASPFFCCFVAVVVVVLVVMVVMVTVGIVVALVWLHMNHDLSLMYIFH